jgi:3',5'-cyclic AMP phosphodiesterase CpdA
MRLAQMTDLHLRHHLPADATRDRVDPRLLDGLAGVLPRLGSMGVDALVMTGDLIDMPEPLGDEQVEPLGRDYRLLGELLATADVPTIVLPGNHDRPATLWDALGRGADVIDLAGHRLVRFCDEEDPSQVPHRVGPDRERFDQVLADAASPPQVHLQHYVIAPALEAAYPYNYADAQTLRQRINAAGHVRLSLSGHYHPGSEVIEDQNASFAIGPAMSEPPFPWRLYDIEGTTIRGQTLTLTNA